ncbi:hypothetical protein Tco_1460707 [Tanacetum coccineum]
MTLLPAQSTLGRKSLAAIGLDVGSTLVTPATQETPSDAKSVNDLDPLSYTKPQPRLERDIFQKDGPEIPTENVAIAEAQDMFSVESPGSGKSTSVPSMVGSLGNVVDRIVPPGYFSELRHLPNADFLSQYNMNLARQVAMGSQLKLRFEQEVRLLKKAKAQIARRDQRIQNLETLLEAKVDMKKAAEAKNTQVTGEERIKAAFEEFKKYKDDRVSSWCAEMDARLDALSIDFDDEEYPHMMTVFANVVSAGIAKGMSEWLKHRIEHGKANLDLAAIEAYDPEADTKYVAALHALKDLKYPLVNQLEK